ncbi:MAG: hypothetical protein GY854_12670, partial [Deltaproteobacteria bacterium]|nr:hypothetical protein [Deltaproteobacteria bacterium]
DPYDAGHVDHQFAGGIPEHTVDAGMPDAEIGRRLPAEYTAPGGKPECAPGAIERHSMHMHLGRIAPPRRIRQIGYYSVFVASMALPLQLAAQVRRDIPRRARLDFQGGVR